MTQPFVKKDPYISRIGALHERPYLSLNFYARISREHGVLSALIVGYLEYLTRTDPPQQVKQYDGQTVSFYALPLVLFTDDLRAILKTPLKRAKVQVRLRDLVRYGFLVREKLGEPGDQTWYYAIDAAYLARYLTRAR